MVDGSRTPLHCPMWLPAWLAACRKKKVKGADGITHEVSRVTSLGVAASELGLDEDSEGHTRLEHLDDFESEELEDEVGAGGQLEEPKLAPVEEEPRSSGYP